MIESCDALENILQNCAIDNDMMAWGLYLGGEAAALNDTSANVLETEISMASDNPWDIQIYQVDFQLSAGKRYQVIFDGWASRNRQVEVHVSLNAEPWTKYDNYQPVNLTSEQQQFVLDEFSVLSNVTNVKLEFWFGGATSMVSDIVYLDNIQLLEMESDVGTGEEIVISGGETKAISPYLFGLNYWMWPSSFNGRVLETQNLVADLNVTSLRMGGAVNDHNDPAFTDSDLVASLNFAAAVGAEPVLQVPVKANVDGSTPTPQTSANMVRRVGEELGYDVEFWSIGNEADLYNDGSDALDNCDSISRFAPAMREANPNIKILGPDLAWRYQTYEPYPPNDWFTPIVENCGEHIDIFTVHRYRGRSADKQGMLMGAEEGRRVIRSLKETMARFGHGDKPLAITEANAEEEWGQTFVAAIWIADHFGVAAEEELWSVMVWSIIEGFEFSLLNQSTLAPHPTYYGFKMISEFFGDELLSVSNQPFGVSVYASFDNETDGVTVVLINKNAQAVDATLRFDQLSRTIPSNNWVLPAESITTVVIPDGSSLFAMQYTESQASAGMPPLRIE